MITEKLASQVIIDILNHELNMPANSVWLRDQNRTIPNDNNLYIEVGLTGAHTISNVTSMITEIDPATQQPVEYQLCQLQQQETIQIDLFSSAQNNYAMLRNWEVIVALQSFYSQQLQEENNFKIFRNPLFMGDTSSAEGGSFIQRYTITIIAFVWYRKQTALNSPNGDYYDDFSTRVDTAHTIGTPTPIIEFEINQDTPPPP